MTHYDTSWCSGCKQDRPRDEFHADKSRSTGLQSNCKDCKKEAAAKRQDRTEQQLRDAQTELNNTSRYVLQLLDFIRSHDLTPPDPR